MIGAYERAMLKENTLANLAEAYLLEEEEGRLNLTEEEWTALDAVRCKSVFDVNHMNIQRLWDVVFEGLETLPGTGINAFEDLRSDLMEARDEYLEEEAYDAQTQEDEKRWEASRDYWDRYYSL